MSNLYKSGFVTYTGQNTLVIDANKNRVIRQLEEDTTQQSQAQSFGEDFEENQGGEGFQSFEIENIDLSDVREQAGAIFEDARTTAEKILEDARAEALILKEEAQQSGREEGYQKGMQDAQSQLEAQEIELQNRYDMLKQKLEEDYEQQIHEMEPQMVDVICRLLHKITGVVVSGYHDVLVHIIDNAIKDVEGSSKLAIKVSEDDYADVYSRLEWIRQQVNSNMDLELIADPKLNKFECLIETDNGIINCSLNEQLDNLITSLQLLANM